MNNKPIDKNSNELLTSSEEYKTIFIETCIKCGHNELEANNEYESHLENVGVIDYLSPKIEAEECLTQWRN